MQIVLRNPASAMKSGISELFSIMTNNHSFQWGGWDTYYLASDAESDQDQSQICSMSEHMMIGAGIQVSNTKHQYNQLTHTHAKPSK